VTALQSFCQIKSLVEVDHQVHLIADCLAHGFNCRKVIRYSLATEPQLESGEAALVA
jgi:hypothetical protein